MAIDKIIIKGACEHNLKCIDVEIPRDKLVVITGISGSGKSTLAFDTIYAEGQRRYVESLSAYARQFLEQMEKPDVESIEGLSPAISIEQKTTSKNPRSTVGTVTEIYDYLRLLFARVGQPLLLQLRQGDHLPDRLPDGGPDHGNAPGNADQPPLPHGAGAQGGVPQGIGPAAQGRLCPGDRRRHAVRSGRGDRSRQEQEARHRHRGRPPHRQGRDRAAPGRLAGDGAQPCRGDRQGGRCRRATLPRLRKPRRLQKRSFSPRPSPASTAASPTRR